MILFVLPEAVTAQDDGQFEIDNGPFEPERGTGTGTIEAGATEAVQARSADANGPGLGGEELFLTCAGCHSLEPANAELIGPHLAGIVGRETATLADYPYSEALAGANFVWDRNVLFSWIVAAESLVPGTHMLHQNHLEPDEVFRLIDFLESDAGIGTVER